jgi:hypothetical protein
MPDFLLAKQVFKNYSLLRKEKNQINRGIEASTYPPTHPAHPTQLKRKIPLITIQTAAEKKPKPKNQ